MIASMSFLVSSVLVIAVLPAAAQADQPLPRLELPDPLITEAYGRAATQNVLAAVNPKVFVGYVSVCADGQGFGYGNSYPSLDGHQLTDALVRLGRVDVARANWRYVRSFQRPDGRLPLAILPGAAGQEIGQAGTAGRPARSRVDPNGGLYTHWVPGDPLRALAAPTYIQNADVIFRATQDRGWLEAQLPSINLAADQLASLTDADGGVRGAGYYVERPARIEYDGVAQCHAADAFRRVAALNALAGRPDAARRYEGLAERIADHFRRVFWVGDHFAEYIHPEHGVVACHGLTDVDWSAIALGLATAEQVAILWPRLKDERRFDYGGMPAGISTLPDSYEAWEFTTDDRYDLAAMGRVWYLQCGALARMSDGPRLVDSIRKVCKIGRDSGYFWRERYTAKGGHGVEKYCEYPANLIRIVQRFLLGVEFGLDGTLHIEPVVPDDFWERGFGQTLVWRGRSLSYRMEGRRITGDYRGDAPQRLDVRLRRPTRDAPARVTIGGVATAPTFEAGRLTLVLPAAPAAQPCRFEIQTDLASATGRERLLQKPLPTR
jgi:hypothetical protein